MSFDFSAVDAVLGGYRQPRKRRRPTHAEVDEPEQTAPAQARPDRPREDADPVTGGAGRGVVGLETAIGAVFSVANPIPVEDPAPAIATAAPEPPRMSADGGHRDAHSGIECLTSEDELASLPLEDLVDALAREPEKPEPISVERPPSSREDPLTEAHGVVASASPPQDEEAESAASVESASEPVAAPVFNWTDRVRRV
ncbi:hypothetical protein [Aurantimonas sp. VKM B-3413]|uniref:hypothetical protein n=1 Tax=Aurantimonas sp. VKM B-3413 TaxID=2779401 RepID=UPI001E49619D|nr:hypothetical protein [Aurantimonas sp. VKM B-3413]MCB8839225.1 hypothetical protein [Aurantimonas sp. VKM B-3413]